MPKSRAAKRRARLARRLRMVGVTPKLKVKDVTTVFLSKRRKQKFRSAATVNRMATKSSVSMVSDGINTGSVWKNTTSERVQFPIAREKIADLTSTGSSYQLLQQLYVNPANSTLFPIFSQIASCYEEYVPTHLKFVYRTQEYTASGSNVSAGLVGLATNFDANDANFSSMTSLENYEHAISGPPFSGIIVHDVLEEHRKRFAGKARDLAQNNYYTYPSANLIGPTSDQAKFYDVGNFQLACNGTQAGIIGELWVEYAFTMIRRKQPEFPAIGSSIHIKLYADDATAASPLGLTPYTTGSASSTGAGVSGTASGSTLSVIDMSGDLSRYTSSTVGLNNSVDTTFNLPNVAAVWLVYCYWSGATALAAAPLMSVVGGATSINAWGPTGTSSTGQFTSTVASICRVVTSVASATPTSATNSCQIGGLTNMTDGNVDIFIVRLPNSLITLTRSANKLQLLESKLNELTRELRQMHVSSSSSLGRKLSIEEDDSLLECKEADLSQSVHIPQTLANKLIRVVGGK